MEASDWYRSFLSALDQHSASAPLRQAAIDGRLADWTAALTSHVVSVCEASGWWAVGRGNPANFLPEKREEYLGLDVTAFSGASDAGWTFPVAVFELENSPSDERVAYSLWKVLCVRAPLRFVFAYRRSAAEATALLDGLARSVVSRIPEMERGTVHGQSSVIVGLKDEVATFPHGYFKPWRLDLNLGRFERLL